jgi:hypothetical protein
MDDLRVKSVRELLSAFFDDEKLSRGSRYAEFFTSWKFLVGDQLAAHSRVAEVERGILIVEAEHPGWIQLLQLRQSTILEGITTRFPELCLRSIVFRLGNARPEFRAGENAPVPQSDPSSAPGLPREEPADNSAVGERAKSARAFSLDSVSDPELRRLLSGLKDAMGGGT